MDGNALLDQLIVATGLPGELVRDELLDLIKQSGKKETEINMDDLRLILTDYLQDVLIKAQKEFS